MTNRLPRSSKNLASWFLSKNKKSLDNLWPSLHEFSDENLKEKEARDKNLPQFFVPGWSADSVFSPSTLNIKKALDILSEDAKERIINGQNFTPSLKKKIYLEFLNFCQSRENPSSQEVQSEAFWKQMSLEKPLEKEIQNFRETFSFRLAYLYLTKLKFLLSLADKLEITLSERNLLFPNSILKRIFRPGSSYELHCESLNKNLYSWYLPSQDIAPLLKTITENLNNLSIAQVMKLSTFKLSHNFLDFSDTSYSHTISHVEFGKLINTFCIFFPIWFDSESFEYPRLKETDTPEILNTLFEGEFLTSLCQSHWLAQSSNLHLDWSEILSPSFQSEKFEEGLFLKLCHELHFLIFLVKFTNKKGYQTKTMIRDIMNHRYANDLSKLPTGQIPLFSKCHHSDEMLQERIVSNIPNLPTKNTHHHLVNFILSKTKQLKTNGYAIFLSNQQLFVPSQANKVKKVQSLFEIKSIMDLSELSGKGEIPKFIYLLKKKAKYLVKETVELPIDTEELNSCVFNLKIKGELNQFRKFQHITESIFSYIKKVPYSKVSYFEQQLDPELSFECHKDALIEGKLLSIAATHSSNITHPNFFQKLAQKCIPLESEFLIGEIEKEKNTHISDFFTTPAPQSRYILMVDCHKRPFCHLQIIERSELKERKKEFGTTSYQYFSITTKYKKFNKELFNLFYSSAFGTQLIQLCSHSSSKGMSLKSTLGSMLIPTFLLADDNSTPVVNDISLKEILNFEANNIEHFKLQLEEYFKYFKQLNSPLTEASLSQLVTLLSETQKEQIALDDFSEENFTKQFSNHLFISKLVHIEKKSLYPNEDLFIQTQCHAEDLARKVTRFQKQITDSGLKLSLYSGDHLLANFFSTSTIIEFIVFILSSIEEPEFGHILNNLKIPSSSGLKKIVDEFSLNYKKLSSTQFMIENTLKESIIELIIN